VEICRAFGFPAPSGRLTCLSRLSSQKILFLQARSLGRHPWQMKQCCSSTTKAGRRSYAQPLAFSHQDFVSRLSSQDTSFLAGKKLRPPSLADEAVLLKYYKGRVQEMCRAFGFPAKVQAAAITFLSRFYLKHSPLEHDVKDIMLVCLYLAGKVKIFGQFLPAPLVLRAFEDARVYACCTACSPREQLLGWACFLSCVTGRCCVVRKTDSSWGSHLRVNGQCISPACALWSSADL